LLVFVLASVAGCSGSGSSSGGGRTDNITAVYSGDTNYTASTSPAAPITIQ
jgi:hypothetical protein